MNWEKLFTKRILERGYDYYDSDMIETLNVEDDRIYAEVSGSELYEVEIFISDDKIDDMQCTCPYAEEGNNCKHMAAVLYAWEEESRPKCSNYSIKETQTLFVESKKDEINELIEQLNNNQIKSFLKEILLEDNKWLSRFYQIVDLPTEERDLESYKSQIRAIANQYGYDDFLNYEQAYEFACDLQEFLQDDVQEMIDTGNYLLAFEVIKYVVIQLAFTEMDDSSGGISMIMDEITCMWSDLLALADEDEKYEMFIGFISFFDDTLPDYLEDYIENIIMNDFYEEEYCYGKLSFIEETIKELEHGEDTWSNKYKLERWLMNYIQILTDKNGTKDEIERFCFSHWQSSAIRKYCIDMYIANKEFDKALSAINESVELDRTFSGLVAEYMEKKKDIYLLQGRKEDYINQLWELLLKYKAGNITTYQELKKQYTQEEWLIKREDVFKNLPKYGSVDKLYQLERLYDRLLVCVVDSPGLYKLHEYIEDLKEKYPEEILQKYKYELNAMASYSANRSRYQEMVRLLKEMLKIKGGKEVTIEIINQWRVKYKNRPAMMDELNKIRL